MDHRLIKRRIVAAILVFGAALAVLLMRYLPARSAYHELGDPAEGAILSGFWAAEADDAAVVRWAMPDARLRLPLADRRGTQQVALTLRGDASQPLVLGVDRVTAVATTAPELRTYHLLTPPSTSGSVELRLQTTPAVAWQPERGLAVDRLVVVGRGGWPPLLDLANLLALALVPALLLILTSRLPFDWALVPSILLLSLYLALPSDDLPALLLFGPLVALTIAGLGLLPSARQHPTLVLLLLAGTALRGYALGWGSGYLFHPDEQALVQGSASEPLYRMIEWTAQRAARVSGNAGWADAWGLVLLGRVWSMLLGSALIVVVYRLGRQLLRPRWVLLAVAYVAFAPVLVQQSHVATPLLFETLLVALLMLSSTSAALWGRLRDSIACGLWSGAVLALCPQGGILLIAPIVAHLVMRQRRRRLPALGTATALAIVCGSLLLWSFGEVGTPAAASAGLPQPADDAKAAIGRQLPSAIEAYAHALFNVLLWSLGPLLMQLSVVGWGVGLVQSLHERRYRVWLPLLWSLGVYFAVGVRSPEPVESLILLVPLLCLTAAWLLQSFGERLPHRFGQRTVRLLAGTGLCLVLATSLGLINVYRVPDPRIAASRWLIAHAPAGKQVLHDASVAERLPIGAAHLYTTTALPASMTGADPQARARYVEALARADYLVLAVDRGDLGLEQRIAADPVAACYYQALFGGRLGFMPRAGFDAQPRIGPWIMDDSWVNPALRRYDHPHVRIFERVVTPTPEAVDLMLNCAGS
ncbi:MAG TPA: glycosyltransferase family 39 protein [Herpetosiphonaceae bacterium]